MPAKQTLIPDSYVPRLIEGRLDTLPQAFGHAEITDPKWYGKTWTALTMWQRKPRDNTCSPSLI